jgi:protein O-mannosyl-transferase
LNVFRDLLSLPASGDTKAASLPRTWPLAVVYAGIGLLAYARILNTFFVADDFAFLDVISRAPSISVIFSALAERYFRPVVVLVYYLNYKISGLSPWTYHVSIVLVHAVNAWLVFLLGRTLDPERPPIIAALAGLLFLVFGGHAEAVTWIGGMADPLITCFLLLALLLFQHALVSPRPIPLFVATWLSVTMALLTKESAAVFLGFAAVVTLLGRASVPDRPRIRRAAIGVAVVVLLLAGYFLVRRHVLGFTFVNLEGLGTSSNLLTTARAFVLRSFFPYGPLVVRVWIHSLDKYVLFPAAVAALLFVRRHDWRPLALLTACFVLAIAPVLPLSIAIARPDSERLIYLPSAFACLLLVWFLHAALRRLWPVATIVLVCSIGHVLALDRVNRRWVTAAMLTRGITSSFREVMRDHGRPGLPVYVLNVPDSVGGAFVYRRGFHDSLRLTAPDQLSKMGRTYVLSVYTVGDASRAVTVTQVGASSFDVRLGSAELIGGQPPPGPFYEFNNWSPDAYSVEFLRAAGPGLVVYFTPQQARVAGTLTGEGVPFGVVDLPPDGSRCEGREATIAGWALDTEGVERVRITVDDSEGSQPETWEAQRYARPDVAAAYADYPDSETAGWIYALPCDALRRHARDGRVRVGVDAENHRGGRTRLGARMILVPR